VINPNYEKVFFQNENYQLSISEYISCVEKLFSVVRYGTGTVSRSVADPNPAPFGSGSF
jgi:hypothetical protein